MVGTDLIFFNYDGFFFLIIYSSFNKTLNTYIFFKKDTS